MQGAGTSGMDRLILMKGKRALQNGEGDSDNDVVQQEKRQKRVILNALRSGPVLPHICKMLEPFVRRVVGDETQKALSRFVSSGQISVPRQIRCASSRNLILHFRSKIAPSIFTNQEVKDCQGLPICIELQDRATRQVVTKGQESAAKLELVVLEGDFSSNDNEDWSWEDFETSVVKERKCKRPLLFGNLTIVLNEGVGTLGDVTFTDNSSWTKSKTFGLGVRLAVESSQCLNIREGKSGAFQVKDHRGKYYEKHYPPAAADDVWRLENIRKDGQFHKKLNDEGIKTVEQFHRLAMRDPQKLKNILGSRMADKEWQDTVAHAQKCTYNYKPVENVSVELRTDNNELARKIYETNSKIDSGNMPIYEKMHVMKEVGCHGKENGAARQCCNANPATDTRYAVQDQQSGQHLPIPVDFLLQETVMCSKNKGFVMSASSCDFLSPQTSLGEWEDFSFLFDTSANNSKHDENASNQELLQITGSSNLPGECLPVFQSLALSPAETCDMYNGDILGNYSERWQKFKVVLLSMRFAIKCLQE